MTSYPWHDAFIAALAAHGVLAKAARATGVAPSTVYKLLKTDSDFAAAVEEAQAEAWDALEAAAVHRATVGVAEPLTYQGAFTYLYDPEGNILLDPEGQRVVATVNKPSDALLQFLLKGYRKKFSTERTEITGADGGAVQMDDTARAARVAALLELGRRRKADNDLTGGFA